MYMYRISSNRRLPRINAGDIKGSIANKHRASIRRQVGPVPAWGRGTVHVHRAVDSKGIAELHLLLIRWHRRDASTCPSSKKSVPVAPLANHIVARTEVNFDLSMRYVA